MRPKFPQDLPVSVTPWARRGRERVVQYVAPWQAVPGADPWSQHAGIHLMHAVAYGVHQEIDVPLSAPPSWIAARVRSLQAKAQHELARLLLADERVADTEPDYPVTLSIKVRVETWPAIEGVTTPERRQQL